LNKVELSKLIKTESNKLGFNLVGITSPHIIKSNNLDTWLDSGYSATMNWISKRKKERKNIFNYFPEIKSIISFGYNYYTGENNLVSKKLKISNYAWGDDYHEVIKKQLFKIIKLIEKSHPNIKYRICVDTSPIVEKYWAQKAGIGWIGKHTNLINENIGSWFFIGEILLDIELNYDLPFENDLCGSCTKCIEACPTNALIEDYVLDSNKCISYLTIEHKDTLPDNMKNKLDNWIYGCDICQQVCPWNIKFSQQTNNSAFKIRNDIKNKKNFDWEKITEDEFNIIFSRSPVKRTKFKGLKRNIETNIKD